MKNLSIFLIAVFSALNSPLCFGQELANENGLRLTYKIGKEKIGSRYDEYCKTTFDIYPVEGTVENTNTDKAAMVTAILSFAGKFCNKIYSNDNNTTGEVTDKLFNLDIWGQAGKQSQYWGNRFVHLLPKEKMTAKSHVEVEQGGKVHEPDKYLTYEIISLQDGASPNKSNNDVSPTSSERIASASREVMDYSKLILGKWTRVHLKNTIGVDEDTSELQYYRVFKPNGDLEFWAEGRLETTYKWSINGNVLIMQSDEYGTTSEKEILSLENAKLIIKSEWPDNKGHAIETLKKMK